MMDKRLLGFKPSFLLVLLGLMFLERLLHCTYVPCAVDFFLIRERGLCVAFYLGQTSELGLAGRLFSGCEGYRKVASGRLGTNAS
jgi:hypothetical protein